MSDEHIQIRVPQEVHDLVAKDRQPRLVTGVDQHGNTSDHVMWYEDETPELVDVWDSTGSYRGKIMTKPGASRVRTTPIEEWKGPAPSRYEGAST